MPSIGEIFLIILYKIATVVVYLSATNLYGLGFFQNKHLYYEIVFGSIYTTGFDEDRGLWPILSVGLGHIKRHHILELNGEVFLSNLKELQPYFNVLFKKNFY